MLARQIVGRPAQIFFYNSLPAVIHLYMIRPIVQNKADSTSSETLSLSSALVKLFISAILTTPLMMLQMAFFQLISGDSQGWPTIRTMMACIVVYLIVIYAWPM